MLFNNNKKNSANADVKTKLISSKGKLIPLIFFCILSSGLSLYTTIRSLSGRPKASFSIGSIEKPKHIHHYEKMSPTVNIGQEEYQRIQNFKKHMDSIGNTPSGRRTFDSLMATRPGLIDSIFHIEHIYLSHTKE